MKGVFDFMNNANLEVLIIDNAKDVEENFFFNSECGAFEFMDKDYTGAVEITSSGARALGDSWRRMFAGTKVSKVIAKDTSNVTNMKYMFWGSKASSIDLSSFDTSNVRNMSDMFWGSEAISLDLSSFDTSNVTDMEEMFSKSNVISIDLRSFDFSNVINMDLIFDQSNIKEILVKTENDANRLQGSSDMTLNLVFNSNSFSKKDITVESEDAETIDKLVRLVLKNVREENISIDDGIEMLKYLFSTKTA